ncbi:E3 SUMO-protein ligase ZBED1-like [Chaetodon auriga]|uniref:E3 SUMO-protein ligase ZBED1-like n=1 Tax=Chaetodon auriga TaxID=39042 RepID=UPI004032AD27
MRTHLLTLHPGKLAELTSDTDEPQAKQARITSFMPASSSRGLSAERQRKITDKLTRFICKDMRPINISQGSGFKDFVQELEPRYAVPSRATISDRVVKLYDATKDNIKKMLSGENISLTTDGWTSIATEAYVTVTAHFINDDWEMKDIILKTAEVQETHTAEHVAECIANILGEYNVRPQSVLSITTDNAANYINAVERHLQVANVPCMVHTINLAVRKGLTVRAIESPINRLKATALHFNKSTTDSYLLESKQRLLGVKPAKLINDCATRWNSTYDMVCRAAEQQAPVAAVIMEKKLGHLELNTNEWSLMEQPSTGDPQALNDMKTKISADLEKRYSHTKDAFMLLNSASYLDPRFHRLIHLTGEQQQEVHDKVHREMRLIAEDEEHAENEEGAGDGTPLGAMGSLLGNVYRQFAGPGGTLDSGLVLQQEMRMYDAETPIPSDSNPLSWWKTSGTKYPHLARLARRYLSIPGTSVRAERVFSTAGMIVNKKRSALDPANVDRLVFLANNL